jgi:hypothetical protein
MVKYLIIAGLTANSISILMDVFTTGFSEVTFYKSICCGWMLASLAAQSKIDNLESDNEILSGHINDIINAVKASKK